MSWFWGKSQPSSSNDGASNDASRGPGTDGGDPVRQLDPKLRDYLDREAPAKYNALASEAPDASVPYKDQVALRPTTSQWSESGVPPQAIYQDGRYADLWKTYKPLEEIENATKTDQDRLLDIVDGIKERKAQISRAALENCSFEQTIHSDCMKFGGWASRMTLCRAENKTFERCYMTQAKFLKALGYLSTYERPAEVEEQIQMHADKLYHRMLRQEAAIEKARAEGKPIPSIDDLLPERESSLYGERSGPFPSSHAPPPQSISSLDPAITSGSSGGGGVSSGSSPSLPDSATNTTPAPDTTSPDTVPKKRYLVPEGFTAAAQAALDERLRGVPEMEREIEAKAFVAELAAGQQAIQRVNVQRQQQEENIRRRRAKGQETFGDWIMKTFRF